MPCGLGRSGFCDLAEAVIYLGVCTYQTGDGGGRGGAEAERASALESASTDSPGKAFDVATSGVDG